MIILYVFAIIYHLFLIIVSSVELNKIDLLYKKNLKISQIVLYSLGFLIYLILSFDVLGKSFLKRFHLFNGTLYLLNFSSIFISFICSIIDLFLYLI
jgi:hypothetical protein